MEFQELSFTSRYTIYDWLSMKRTNLRATLNKLGKFSYAG